MGNFKTYIDKNKERFLNELFELLRIPSISANSENDPDIKIKWPIKKPILSKKDSLGIELRKIKNLPRWKK